MFAPSNRPWAIINMPKNLIKVSDKSVNSYGFGVDTAGVKLERFKSNPVLLFNHDMGKVIGRIPLIEVDGDNLMIGEPEWDEADEFAKEIKRKYDAGFIKGFSIGIDSFEFGIENDQRMVLSSELLEISICPVPSNRNAIKLYAADGNPMDEAAIRLFVNESNSNQIEFNNQSNMNKKTILLMLAGAKIQHNLTENSSDEQFGEILQKHLTLGVEAQEKLSAVVKARAATLINLAVGSGKIKETDRAKWVERAEKDYEMTSESLDFIPATKVVNLSADVNSLLDTSDKGGEQVPAEKKDWTARDWEKKDPQGFALMAKSNPTLFKKLNDAAYGVVKTLVVALIACATLFFGASDAFAQSNKAGGITSGGKKMEWRFADGITSNTVYNFPSFDYQSFSYDDTITVTVNQLETYVAIASLTGNVRLVIELGSNIEAGAKIFVNIAGTDQSRTVTTVNSESLLSESITVTAATRRTYLYTGSAIVLLTKNP